MKAKLIPVPDESWGCLPCTVDLQKAVDAVVILVQEEPELGISKAGLCGNHAEVWNVDGLAETPPKFHK